MTNTEVPSTGATARDSEQAEVYIGRQPIFDRDLNVYAYELLFRRGGNSAGHLTDGTQATAEVIVNTFTEFGLDQVVGHHPAFINLTTDFILGKNPLPLPPDRVVLEVLEDVTVDAQLVQGVERLAGQGFTIALDDFVYDDKWLPLLRLCDIVKVEVPVLDEQRIREHLQILRKYPVKLLAEKIETREEFEHLKDLGFDLFQGYFLARPKTLRSTRIPSNQVNILRLIARLNKPGVNMDQLEDIIRTDVSISYKILRYINSASFSLPRKVESVRQAIVFLGMDAMKRWASLIAMSELHTSPSELFRLALVRARMCEHLAGARSLPNTDTYFTLGLFSALDALLGLPMAAVLNELPLDDELKSALLTHAGVMGGILQCTLAYEQPDWDGGLCSDLPIKTLRAAYMDAVTWTEQHTAGL